MAAPAISCRRLHRFLGLDRHLFKSQHGNLISSIATEKRAGTLASPFLLPQFSQFTSLRQRPSPEFRR